MTIEDEINELLADAKPLRLLDDDDPKKAPLTDIVDSINALRAKQAQIALEALAVTPMVDVPKQPTITLPKK